MAELVITCPSGADTPEGASKGGDYALSWIGPKGGEFQLVETPAGGEPLTLYQGQELGSAVTGRAEGDYQYNVGLVEHGQVTTWSEPCRVLVTPYSLPVAFSFFAFGLIVTLSTIALVVSGHRAHRRGEIG